MTNHKQKISGPHFIMSAENPKFPEHNKLKMGHQEALNNLRSNGHDAHEVMGHYGAPERSIVVYNPSPKHVEQLHNMASSLGQDSSIHSSGSEHEMRFHHGTDKGKKVTGSGTQWHEQTPKDMYTTLPDNQGSFTHNFNFDKSELNKAPIESQQDHFQPSTEIDGDVIHKEPSELPGLFHVISRDNSMYNHYLVNDKDNIAAQIAGTKVKNNKTGESGMRVTHSIVDPAFEGLGLGRHLYGKAAQHHGLVVSDKITSPKARKAYESFIGNPDYDVRIGRPGHEEQNDVDFGTPHTLRHKAHPQYKDQRKLAPNKKLAASEKVIVKTEGGGAWPYGSFAGGASSTHQSRMKEKMKSAEILDILRAKLEDALPAELEIEPLEIIRQACFSRDKQDG